MVSEAPPRQTPTRDDCWTEEASATLVDAWGRRYLELNRGNLRQKDWQEVAAEVNALHGHSKKTRRTDVQCKNRIDTLKKKYKVEKVKIAENDGTMTSSWPFFSRMDFLIGSSSSKPPSKPNLSAPSSAGAHPTPITRLPSPPMALPLPYDRGLPCATPVVMPQKRPLSSAALDGAYSLRNYSAMAAAAAAAAEDEEVETDADEEGSEDGDAQEEESWLQGMRKVAEAIEQFGEMFERVEKKKQKLILDLEKQRMLFVQDLEVRRMQWFTDTLAQQQRKKQPKRSGSSDARGYGFADAYQ